MSVHPSITAIQEASEVFACGLKLKAIGLIQPGCIATQFNVNVACS